MTSALSPSLGSVVWAEMADPRGHYKVRPAILVSIEEETDTGEAVFYLVAVTTRLPSPLPSSHVLLPWSPQGNVRTGLRKKCAAVTTWIASLPPGDIKEIVGVVPPSVLGEILEKIETGS